MLFNSLDFVLFLAVVLLVHHGLLVSWEARKRWLVAASWFFYATWSPRFLILLLATTWASFHLARAIARARVAAPPRAHTLLAASIVLNLAPLAFFKYGHFLYEQIALVAPLPPTPGFLAVAVPLGISFYTFHALSYLVDTSRGLRPPSERFGDFALYIAFFPQLVAGPITRWSFFGPQLDSPPRIGRETVEDALFLLAKGYVKKVVFADGLGGFVDHVYGNPGGVSPFEIGTAVYAYAFQIYFDFSGYTDIAWGLAGLVGLKLPENFRHPYLAINPSDFWRRWHISLSTWLRDYLYIPLGGSRHGSARTYANLMITMLLGGLWHGAAWSFVLWGGLHGLWLAVHRWLSSVHAPTTPTVVRRLTTFHLVALAWVLFRAPSLGTIAELAKGLITPSPLSEPVPLGTLLLILVGALSHGLAERRDLGSAWRRLPRVVQGTAYGVVILLVGLFSGRGEPFIYFQF